MTEFLYRTFYRLITAIPLGRNYFCKNTCDFLLLLILTNLSIILVEIFFENNGDEARASVIHMITSRKSNTSFEYIEVLITITIYIYI